MGTMRQFAWAIAAVFVLMIPSPALGGDVEDLQAAYERYIEIVNARDDPRAMVDAQHADFQVSTNLENPFFGVRNGKATAEGVRRFWTSFERFTVRPYQTQYQVIGDTGLVWGHRLVQVKMKDADPETRSMKVFMVFAKVDGKWKQLGHMYAPLMPPS